MVHLLNLFIIVYIILFSKFVKTEKLRVLTYNIRHAEGLDGKVDVERIASIIKSQSVDVVSVQEVDDDCSRSQHINEPEKLSSLLDFGYVFGRSIPFEGGEYGDLLLYNRSNLELKNYRKIKLPGKEPREMIIGNFQMKESSIVFDFLVTHFPLELDNRLECVKLIDEEIVKNKTGFGRDFLLLTGDLNAQLKSTTVKSLENEYDWVNTNIDNKLILNTFSTKHPYEQIDFVFFNLQERDGVSIRVENIRVVNSTEETRIASDHFPLFVELEITKT